VTIERITNQLVRVQGHFGFMELPQLASILQSCAAAGVAINGPDTSYVVAAPQVVPP
jgi:K+ transporter